MAHCCMTVIREYSSAGYAGSGFPRKSTGANGRKLFSTNTYRKLVLFLLTSPKVSGNPWEFSGEGDLGMLYSSSLFRQSWNLENGFGRFLRVIQLALSAHCSLGLVAFRGLAPKGPQGVDSTHQTPSQQYFEIPPSQVCVFSCLYIKHMTMLCGWGLQGSV